MFMGLFLLTYISARGEISFVWMGSGRNIQVKYITMLAPVLSPTIPTNVFLTATPILPFYRFYE